MTTKTISFTIRYWTNPQTHETRLKICRVDLDEEVPLKNSSFLLRIGIDEYGRIERCYIRHIATGRDAFVQGGRGFDSFVRACLFDGSFTNTAPAQVSEADTKSTQGDLARDGNDERVLPGGQHHE